MKKFATIVMLFAAVGLIVSCGKKATPEEEVRNYGKYFVEKLNANQLDSLKASYPDIAKADSIGPLQSDTIMVVETAPGQYDVTLAEGITLKVSRSDEGSISVTESKGLFAFPTDKVDIAKKTGMWNESLTDAQASERIHDEEFFEFLEAQGRKATSNIITVGRWTITKEWYGNDSPGMATQTITNNTDQPISGADYQFVMISEDPYTSASGERPRTWNNKGKDIPPHGSIKENFEIYNQSAPEIKSIKWNLTPQQLKEKFASYTGNEYQEYLNSKK